MILKFFLVCVVCLILQTQTSAYTLLTYNISDVTVSGISSGGYMANQFHISHSSFINAAAIFAAGPFYCAESTILYAEDRCMSTTIGEPQVEKLVETTRTDANLGYIDSPSNLADDRVYIFSGKADTVVSPVVVKALEKYYSYFMSPSNIVADFDLDAEHCLPTLNYGEKCTTRSSPFLGNCNFDGAGTALQVIYQNTLKNPYTTGVTDVATHLYSFDQKPYIVGLNTAIDNTGYIYVPTNCANGKRCHLHVSFHGCEQGNTFIGNIYAAHSGFNPWAEANDIIVLYPYAIKTTVPNNPNGCWDWWAYTNVYYGVKSGVQVSFVKRVIDKVTGTTN